LGCYFSYCHLFSATIELVLPFRKHLLVDSQPTDDQHHVKDKQANAGVEEEDVEFSCDVGHAKLQVVKGCSRRTVDRGSFIPGISRGMARVRDETENWYTGVAAGLYSMGYPRG
jgi:hypothetical protein